MVSFFFFIKEPQKCVTVSSSVTLGCLTLQADCLPCTRLRCCSFPGQHYSTMVITLVLTVLVLVVVVDVLKKKIKVREYHFFYMFFLSPFYVEAVFMDLNSRSKWIDGYCKVCVQPLTRRIHHPAVSCTLQSPTPACSSGPRVQSRTTSGSPGQSSAGTAVPPDWTPGFGSRPACWRTGCGSLPDFPAVLLSVQWGNKMVSASLLPNNVIPFSIQ